MPEAARPVRWRARLGAAVRVPGRRRAARRGAPATPRPPTRAARRQAAKVRRARATLGASAVLSALIMVLWFPAGALMHQRAALNATAAELNRLHREDRQLAQEQKALRSPAEIARVARQQYQLVNPGERAYLVLPPDRSKSASSSRSGDPGSQPLASPSAASELPPGGPVAGAATPSSSSSSSPGSRSGAGAGGRAVTGRSKGAAAAPSPGFLGRIGQTLEFWR